MTAHASPAVERIVLLPAAFTLYEHQREALAARQAGARRLIWRWHRGAGKGIASVALVVREAFQRPAQHIHVSPSFRKAREDVWDAIDADSGLPYLAAIPPELVVARNENDLTITMRTRVPGKVSHVMFLSADQPDRLRGVHPATAVLDEYATWQDGGEGLRVLRPALERARGVLCVTSTPKGSTNHYASLWRAVEGDPAWWCSLKTIEDTRGHDGQPLIPLSVVEQERKEGVEEAWLRQEYFCDFASAMLGSYFGELLDRMEQEERIGDFPWHSERPTTVALDLGVSDSTVATYWQDVGERRDLIDEQAFQGLHLGEILSRIRGKPYNLTAWIAPHDVEVRDLSNTMAASGEAVSRRKVAERLGVSFKVAPRLTHPEYHDAIRRLMASRLRIHRRTCPKTLEALASYGRDWDARLKTYKDRPRHDEHSHYVDSVKTYAVGYQPRTPRSPGWRPTPAKMPRLVNLPWLREGGTR